MSEFVAALDLGSNSFHLLLGSWDGLELTVMDRVKERVQLAAGLDENGMLSQAAQQRGLDCLHRFAQRIQGADRVRIVGTSALRQAQNRNDFLVAAEQALGCPIEVISGEEEGRLIYLGVAQVFGNDRRRRLVLDIGGGSTEVVAGRQFTAERALSVPTGCVTLTRAFFDASQGEDEHSQAPAYATLGEAFLAAEAAARAGLRAALQDSPVGDWRHAVGTSGTIESIRDALVANGWARSEITRAGIQRLREHLLRARSLLDLNVSGLPLDRVDIFPAGCAILCACFEELELETLDYADASLREGVVFDLLGYRSDENVLVRTVRALQQRFAVDQAQSARVDRVAQAFLQQIAEPWGLTQKRYERLLAWAAALHEIGLAISHHHHHRHGAYLIRHSAMAGFSPQLQQRLAALVRGHRRGFPRMTFEAFAEDERQPLIRLCVVLRLAHIWCFTRMPSAAETLPALSVRRAPGAGHADTLVLRLPPQWTAANPLLAGLLGAEQTTLVGAGIELAIES